MRKRRLLTAEPPGETAGLARRVRRMAFPLSALHPLHLRPALEKLPETYPWGV